MTKAIYLLVALVILLPSLVAGVMTLYATQQAHRLARETPRDPGDAVHVYTQAMTFAVGKTEIRLYPRPWAAVLVLFGFVGWLVGVVVLLFIRYA